MSCSDLWVVVMAGGSGTRFWPLSRRDRPKQLLALAGGGSLLRETVDRLLPLVPAERVVIVAGAVIEAAVRHEVPDIPPANVLIEPEGRDTAPCVGLAAWWLARQAPGAIMAVLPADHAIPDGGALCAALDGAAVAARERGALITLGVRPTRAETGFGYLEVGETVAGTDAHPVQSVVRFVEKPPRHEAEAMVASGRFRWNAGMFVWRVDVIEAKIRTLLPELAQGLDEIFASPAGLDRDRLAARYPSLPRISIDYGVMERAGDVLTVPVDFAWSDLGSWPGLAEAGAGADGSVCRGDVVAIECPGSIVVSDGPLIAAVGVRDLVIVATRDAVLVVPREQAQRVREVVEALRAAGREDLL